MVHACLQECALAASHETEITGREPTKAKLAEAIANEVSLHHSTVSNIVSVSGSHRFTGDKGDDA